MVVMENRTSGDPSDAGRVSQHREVWWLDARAQLSVGVTEWMTGTDQVTTRVVYRRQQ
jgi:hypothetical protein